MMNLQSTILIFLLSICVLNSAHAGWFDSEKTKKRDKADFIVKECLLILQENADKNTNTKVKIEAYAGDINILSENLVLMKVIFLSSYDNYASKQEKEGVCRYLPESKSISWKPLLF